MMNFIGTYYFEDLVVRNIVGIVILLSTFERISIGQNTYIKECFVLVQGLSTLLFHRVSCKHAGLVEE